MRRLGVVTLVLALLVGGLAAVGLAQSTDERCVADPVGDQRADLNPDRFRSETASDEGSTESRTADPAAELTAASADVVEVCIAVGDQVTVSVRMAAEPDPDDVSWRDLRSAVVVALDTQADGSAEHFVVIGIAPPEAGAQEESPTAAVTATVTDGDGELRCTPAATLDGAVVQAADIPLECLEGAQVIAVQVSAVLATDPTDAYAPLAVDIAPDSGYAGPEGLVAPAGRVVDGGRLAGPERIATSIQISQAAFPQRASSVYLARADVLVDAVTGGSLTDGPVLITPSCGDVPAVVSQEIARVDPERVVALGGEDAICDEALDQAAEGRRAGRLAGPDRVATATAIATEAFPVGASEVYLAGPDRLADAVPGGVLTQGPVLLVPSCDGLPDVVEATLERLVPERVYALGGTEAVCDDTLAAASEISAASNPVPTLRLGGEGRLDTAVAIADREFPGGARTVYLARADVFADSVAGGVLRDGPILLVPGCGEVPATVLDQAARLRPDRVVALGGQAAVCDATLGQVVQAVG